MSCWSTGRISLPVPMTPFAAGTDDDGTEAIAFAFEPTGKDA